jgi:O-glycosyl hydrolase
MTQTKQKTSPAIRVALSGLVVLSALLVLLLPGGVTSPGSESGAVVRVLVDNTQPHQTMEGFGATHTPLVHGLKDDLSPSLRAEAIDAVYRKVGLTTGNVEVGVLEAPANATDPWKQQANDDDDPFHFNWNGFNFKGSDTAKRKLIDLARPKGFDNFYLELKVNVRWANPWLKALRAKDYNRYLDECAEQVAAGQIHWRDAYGIVPRYVELFNEPTSGNQELDPGSFRELIDITRRTGGRLRREGFADIKFVVPGEETEAKSLEAASAILSDPVARQYVGAIAYHVYPYGSIYCNIANILRTSGQGRPDAEMIAIRNKLRDLGKQYGLPVWMTEVSHGGVPARSFDDLLGRAIHIHDELVYADAAAYFAMLNFWDIKSQEEHFGNMNGWDEDGPVVIIDDGRKKVYITGMGGAIGHYARWIRRGAVRIEATSGDPLLLVTAFRDDGQERLVVVLINTARQSAMLQVQLNGFAGSKPLSFQGEQSVARTAWTPVAPFVADTPSSFNLTVPPRSVTTIAAGL